MKIGIMGGSFNPIHLGHLMMSEYIREDLDLDRVLFIPTGDAPHKEYENVRDYDRYAMVKLAIEDNPKFFVSDIEMKREGKSYSVDTLNELKKENPEGEFYFFLGSDILMDLKKWKKFGDLAKLCTFVCAIRPGFEAISEEVAKNEISYLKEMYNADVILLHTPRYEISSTDLRNRMELDISVRYLITKPVIQYIKEHDLYGGYHGI
ncbi:nicotinate-nucleotide adenylyltransferase [Peptoniphilus sp. KCTC 25270]|uniref:nicotinate-nucleotide adenylyltransferase n=1 Tax=Peptoniphilus sp. KCTC 25270 TaxID=2897414 RepID=UPI001E40F2EB|nr:nicotinate-nucleotide adenylyltransferase [Peptoniphilus sp. KCTC 25270]MCD1146922.1 nicotinate-nucleotide adenylyltransferase [Peptoniphilus sp. KCTC 25270]